MKTAKDTKYIGALIKDMRRAAGMSQMKLAEKIGVSYQQIQKYEKGASQLNIPRLFQMADAFGVPAGTFLINGEAAEVAQVKPQYSSLSEDEAKLVMLFRRLRRKKLRDGFVDMLRDIVRLAETTG